MLKFTLFAALVGAVVLADVARPQSTNILFQAQLSAGGPQQANGNVQFGASVAVDGDTAVIGAPFFGPAPVTPARGAAFVFVRNGSTWTQQGGPLIASDWAAGDQFGSSVAISGNTILVGAPMKPYAGPPVVAQGGTVYVFVRNGTTWSQQARLDPTGQYSAPAVSRQLGFSVALQGDTAVLGAPQHDGGNPNVSGAGSVWVFQRSGSTWSQVNTLPLVSPTLGAGLNFGFSVSIDGDRLIAGEPNGHTGALTSTGAAHVFGFDGTAWSLEQTLPAPPFMAGGDRIGNSVAIVGQRAFVGAPFHRQRGGALGYELVGGAWSQAGDAANVFSASLAPGDQFGSAVSFRENAYLIGAPGFGGSSTGRAFVVTTQGGFILQNTAFTPGDRAGAAVAIAGDSPDFTALVGAPLDDPGAVTDAGSAFAWRVRLEAGGSTLCFGDGSSSPCPCGNESTVGAQQGCRHTGSIGMTIWGHGSTSIADDDLTLVAEQCPPGNSGLFYAGTVNPVLPFYDGLQCVGGDVRRFQAVFQSGGVASDTGFVAQDPSGVYFQAGNTYYFQYWSRDVASGPSPCGTGANLSPAYAVTMTP